MDDARKSQLPWIEKYRPKKLADVMVEESIMSLMNNMVKNKEFQNIILTGSPGVGKTSTVKSVALELYGPYYSDNVLEINASDDRGIKVQDDISIFCKLVLSYKSADIGRYANHKLIILDEADNITPKAQRLINTIMEQYTDKTRFAFTCNSSYKIIQSLQSRCKIIRYPRLQKGFIVKKLRSICDIEKVPYKIDALDLIAQICNGDMRIAINILNSSANQFGKISNSTVSRLYDRPHPEKLLNLFDVCQAGKLDVSLDSALKIKAEGYCCRDIIINMINVLKSDVCNGVDESVRVRFMKILCTTMYNISKGVDTDLQLVSCIAQLVQHDVAN